MKKKNRHQFKMPISGELVQKMSVEEVLKNERQGKNIWAEDTHGNERTKHLELRLEMNVMRTGHPFHHLTGDGTIVEPDPAVEYMLATIPPDDRDLVIERWTKHINPHAPKAVPVNRMFYPSGDYYGDLLRKERG